MQGTTHLEGDQLTTDQRDFSSAARKESVE